MRFAVLFGIAAAGLGGCCFCPPGPPSTYTPSTGATPYTPPATTEPAMPPTPPAPAIEATVCQVQDAYQTNEVAAAQAYPPGAHIIVTGTVDNVATSWGDVIVHPRRCMFAMVRLAAGQESIAASLSPGTRFTADCTMGNFVLAASFDDCRITVN
jgi:hypothetical protein